MKRMCALGYQLRPGARDLLPAPEHEIGVEIGDAVAAGELPGTQCPCRKSDPDVLVVETAENRPRKNPANGMNYT
jgi:hypothetical protein